MTLPHDNTNRNAASPSTSTMDRDVLISRIVDACAGTSPDWLALRDCAATDPTIWSDLAESTRDAAALERAIAPAVSAAEHVEMPRLALGRASVDRGAVIGRIGPVRGRAFLGWGVAALVAMGWAAQWLTPTQGTGMNAAGLGSALVRSPDAALREYLDVGQKAGRVVAEMPERIVLESRPAADGKGYEVLYVRQLLERAVVDDVYKMGVNEAGKTVLVPARPGGTPSSGPAM